MQPLQATPKEMVRAEPTNNRTAGIDELQNSSDAVEAVTFETETWLKFRDEIETSSKTPRPRLVVRDRDSRLQNLCILLKFFKKCRHHF